MSDDAIEQTDESADETLLVPIEGSDVQVRNLAKRELDIRIVPWGVEIDTADGLEEFTRGAFADTNPSDVFLMGLEHEAHLGLGQNGQPVVTRHPVGKAISLDDRPDAQYGTFRVAKTARGDEVLALAAEGIVKGASLEMAPVEGGSTTKTTRGRRKTYITRARMNGVSTTYRPAYETAGVVAVRSADHKEDAPVAQESAPAAGAHEVEEATAARAEIVAPSVDLGPLERAFSTFTENMGDRLSKMEERYRSDFQPPASTTTKDDKPEIRKGDWAGMVLKSLAGERIPDQQYRVFQDVVTADNLGVVPEAFLSEMIGVIDPSRPFLATTRRMPLPAAGMTINVPVITQRPSTAVQSAEKAAIASQKTIITSTGFDAVTIAGGADISVQVLRRSSPSYLDLFLELLGEAYAIDAEDQALDALIAAVADGGPEPASALDPENLSLGNAFVASFDATRRAPDTIWMSTQAVGEFIDAKASGTNAPLYPGLQASATAAGGITGTISGLRPVHVPTLDAKGAYAIVGPSSGFGWTEDGTFTLQVDVPSKAGRDVALVGILWFLPLYPAAFSLYNVAS